MEGPIYERNDGTWVSVINMPRLPGEKRNRKNIYGKTEAESKQKRNKIIYEMSIGEYTEPVKDTLIGFLNEYWSICEPRWEDTTSALYKMYIDVHLKPYFLNMKLVDVKPITLDKFYKYKLNNEDKRKIAPSVNTIRKYNTFLKAAFNYAIKNGIIKTNPTNSVMLAKKKKYNPSIYNEDQFAALLESVINTEDEIPILLAGGCGMRRGEVFGLRWENVDFKKKSITVKQTSVRFDKDIEKSPKTESSSRTFIAADIIIDKLERYREKVDGKLEDRVITKWKPSSYSQRFNRLLDKFGMVRIRLHDLRHYNAVIMLKYGISDKVSAERLGHSDVSTLRGVYQHVLEEMDQSAASMINNSLSIKKVAIEREP